MVFILDTHKNETKHYNDAYTCKCKFAVGGRRRVAGGAGRRAAAALRGRAWVVGRGRGRSR
jgi:hypothetical protein